MKELRRFQLNRLEDETGVSGTGIIAAGVQFTSGRCVLEWQTQHTSITMFQDKDEMMKVHGHGGKTVLEWIDSEPKTKVAVLIVDNL